MTDGRGRTRYRMTREHVDKIRPTGEPGVRLIPYRRKGKLLGTTLWVTVGTRTVWRAWISLHAPPQRVQELMDLARLKRRMAVLEEMDRGMRR